MRFTQGVGWSVAQAYSSSNTYTWFPPVGQNALQVWVKSGGSSASYDAYMSTGMFTVVPTARITSFTTNAAFPAAYNIPLTFTATATGGSMTQYKFFIYSASTGGWKLAQDYSSSNTFTWFPPLGQNAVQVWVRAANSTADFDDWSSIGLFSVITTPPRVTAFFSNVPFPAAPTTTQIWSAFAVGSVPLEYKFLRFDEGAGIWSIVRDWSPTNQAYYTPGVAGAGWQAMQVWVRGVGSAAPYEAWSGTNYMLVSSSTGINLVSNRPLTGLRVGDMVTWNASVTGGAGPWEYKFMTYDYRGWIVQQGYTTQNTFSWYPPAGSCAMQVWIRTAGSHASWERYMSSGMFVVTP